MTEEDDIDLDELKRQTAHGDRLNAEADNDARLELKETILDELAQIDASEKQKTVSIWDAPTAAYVRALVEHPEHREEVGQSLRRQLDVDAEGSIERSELVRLALRLGLQQANADKFEILGEAVRERALEGL